MMVMMVMVDGDGDGVCDGDECGKGREVRTRRERRIWGWECSLVEPTSCVLRLSPWQQFSPQRKHCHDYAWAASGALVRLLLIASTNGVCAD